MATFLTQAQPEDDIKKLLPGETTPGINPGPPGETTPSPFGKPGASPAPAPAQPAPPVNAAPAPVNAAPMAMDRAQPMAPSPAAPAPAAPPAAPPAAAPAGGPLDINQVTADLKGEFTKKFGRDISEAEIAGLQQHSGWSPGQPMTPEIKARMSQLIQGYTGDPNNPGVIPPAGAAAPVAATPTPGETTGNEAQNVLQQLLKTGTTGALGNVDMNNPAIVAQKQAFERANQSATSKERLAAAERSAARGTSGTGGFDAELSAIERGAGDRAVGFDSQLLKGELDNQRQQVMQALALATQSGDATQARMLQEKLGNLDAQIRREGMADQKMLGKGQLSLGLLQAMMGDQRAKDALGFNYASLGQQGRQFDLSTILNGL